MIGAILSRLLPLQRDLHCLSFFVQIYVSDVAPIKRQVLLAHRVRVQGLVHAICRLPVGHGALAAGRLGLLAGWVHLLRELTVSGSCHAASCLHDNAPVSLGRMQHTLVPTVVLLVDQVDLDHVILEHLALLLALLLLLFDALLEQSLFE